MLVSIGYVRTGMSHVDLVSVRIPTKMDKSSTPMKGRKLTVHLKEVAKKMCGLLEHAIEGMEGRPSGGLRLTLKVSEGRPVEAQEMFDVLSKELSSMDILWNPVSNLRATVGGHASLKGRRRS